MLTMSPSRYRVRPQRSTVLHDGLSRVVNSDDKKSTFVDEEATMWARIEGWRSDVIADFWFHSLSKL